MLIKTRPASLNWPDRIVLFLVALLGAMGVTLAAAEAHIAPGTALHSAALLALVTAPACLAVLICGHTGLLPGLVARALALMLWLGSFLFGISLSAKILGPLLAQDHALTSPLLAIAQIPMLAPFGGSVMIVAWLLCACAALLPRR